MNEPTLATRDRGAFRFEWGDPERVLLEFDLVRSERGGEVTAEILVTSMQPRMGGVLHHARVNLVSTRARAELAKHLGARAPELAVDWHQLLEYAARETVLGYRAGAPAIRLRDAPEPEAGGRILPPLLEARMPTLMFGDGGSAKSVLALAAALSIDTGRPLLGLEPTARERVAYLDWEMDASEHRIRARALLGEESDLLYVPCSRPLSEDVDRLRRILARDRIGYVVVDSVALACDGPPEAAEVAARFFQALRELGTGSLLIAHVNRSGDTDRPFGSAFWHNMARRTWYVKRSSEEGSSHVTVSLLNKKANTGPREPSLHYRISWTGGGIAIRPATLEEVAEIPELVVELPAKPKILMALKSGAMSKSVLAKEIGESLANTEKTLSRLRADGKVTSVRDASGAYLWGLAA